MKKIIVIIAVLSKVFLGQAQENRVKPIWDYPIKPGTEEWVALGTRVERLRISQIPDEILKTISTENLVMLCLNYPFRIDFFLHNNRQKGIKKIAAEFNGLQELFFRKDNVQYLFVLLKNKELDVILGNETLDRGEFALEISLIETILAHESILANATSEQQANIASIALKNLNIKERHTEVFGHSGLETTAYLLYASLRNLNNFDSLNPDLELFFSAGGSFFKPELLEKLRQNYTITINR